MTAVAAVTAPLAAAGAGQPRYRELALRCVAWLDVATPAGVHIYAAEAGRCNDKVFADGTVDTKAGAESAIEAGMLHPVRCRPDGARRIRRRWHQELHRRRGRRRWRRGDGGDRA